jgi:maltose/moltooligosaccharide transporter
MGIINMMIVIPMIIQTITFGPIYHYLLNNNPNNAIEFASMLLLLAAIGSFYLFKTKKEGAIQ